MHEFPELPGWTFEIEEVSAGVYKGAGRDRSGRTVEGSGVDPDALLRWLERAAKSIAESRPSN